MAVSWHGKTSAINLRNALYDSTEGALMNSYPNGSGTRPVRVPIPENERKVAMEGRKRLLSAWAANDHRGYTLWLTASAILDRDAETAELQGWSAHIFEESGLKMVDPCEYCKECRKVRENMKGAGDYSHWAVSTQGEPLDLRMDMEWTPGVPGVRFTLSEMDDPKMVYLITVNETAVIPLGVVLNETFNTLVRDTLLPLIPAGSNVTNPINAFHRFALEWSYGWVNGRYA